MGVYLSDCLDQLDAPELRRLQLLLKVILRSHAGTQSVRACLRSVFARMGRTRDILEPLGKEAQQIFHRLLASFGRLQADDLSEGDAEALARNPFTVILNDGTCVVSAEAMEHLCRDPEWKRQGYLFANLAGLPKRERRSWARWLNIDAATDSTRRQAIYAELAAQSTSEAGLDARHLADSLGQNAPRYLSDFFPDDPNQHPMAWFYRGVLPLYAALADSEARGTQYDARTRGVIEAFRLGRLTVREEKGDFGQPTRFRIVPTLEQTQVATGSAELYQSAQPADTKQSYLF